MAEYTSLSTDMISYSNDTDKIGDFESQFFSLYCSTYFKNDPPTTLCFSRKRIVCLTAKNQFIKERLHPFSSDWQRQ